MESNAVKQSILDQPNNPTVRGDTNSSACTVEEWKMCYNALLPLLTLKVVSCSLICSVIIPNTSLVFSKKIYIIFTNSIQQYNAISSPL